MARPQSRKTFKAVDVPTDFRIDTTESTIDSGRRLRLVYVKAIRGLRKGRVINMIEDDNKSETKLMSVDSRGKLIECTRYVTYKDNTRGLHGAIRTFASDLDSKDYTRR